MKCIFTNKFLYHSCLFAEIYYRPKVIARSVNLSFKILGDNDNPTEPGVPPIFLLHGLLESKKQWEGLGKTILTLTQRPVVAVDMRNHGDSPHASSHKYHELAGDVLQLFTRLAVNKASLIGHSMGGMTSMCMSLLAPEKVAGILVVDISPVTTCPHLTEYYPRLLSAMKELDFKGHTKPRNAKKMVRKKLKNIITNDQVMRTVLSNVDVKQDGTIGWLCNVEALIKNFKHVAKFPKSLKGKSYAGPALFVGGQLSEFLPPDDMPGIRAIFPQAVITYVPGTGHNVHIDDPRTFLEFAIAFIRTNDL